MPAKSTWRWLAVLWLLGAAAVARAHDPFISYTDVRLYPDRMEVKCSLASFTALMLENPNPTNALPVLDDDNFTSFEPMFKRQGARLFEMTAGETNLVARAVDARLSSEGDAVDFTIVYPRPPVGPLRISPAYVKRLPDQGYGTALVVYDEAGQQIAFDDNLNPDNMTLDLKVPPPAESPPATNSPPPAGIK